MSDHNPEPEYDENGIAYCPICDSMLTESWDDSTCIMTCQHCHYSDYENGVDYDSDDYDFSDEDYIEANRNPTYPTIEIPPSDAYPDGIPF